MKENNTITSSDPRSAGVAALYLTTSLYEYLVAIGALTPADAAALAEAAAERADHSGQRNRGPMFEEGADLCRELSALLRALPGTGGAA